jgi:hypothetical protein
MPTYVLKNTDTDEIFEKVMKISEYEIYMKENTNIIRHHDSVAPIIDPGQQPPSDFQKYIVDSIQRRNPGASPSRKYKTPKEW